MLKAHVEITSPEQVVQIFNEIEDLQRKIENLSKEKVTQEAQIDLQYACQWFEWAFQYLPPGSPERDQAQKERDAIPYKPEILPQKNENKPKDLGKEFQPLIQNLQKLRHSLRKLSARLTM